MAAAQARTQALAAAAGPPPNEVKTQEAAETRPAGPDDYLKVTGTPGIPVSCAVMDGNLQQRTVDAKVPTEIPLKEMDSFTATSQNQCQKTGAKGTLMVAIVIDGNQEASNQTSAAYGIASVGYPN